jgi:AhpD family alkylhydroperoxidase
MLMTARMTNPAFAVDGAMDALNALSKSISRARLPIGRELVHLRASQINGCSVCVDMHAKAARTSGESEERVFAVADEPEPVPDAIWDAAAEHFDETQLGGLVLDIATVNLWNRLNIATRQVVGEQSW